MSRDKVGWHWFFSIGILLHLLVVELLSGCDGRNSKSAPPVGPDLRGRWSGVFYETDGGGQLSLTATVREDGDAVIIKTSRSDGIAVQLTGTVYENGDLDVIDAFDGQEWSSLFGPATTNHIELVDYVETPSLENPDPPLYVLDLTR